MICREKKCWDKINVYNSENRIISVGNVIITNYILRGFILIFMLIFYDINIVFKDNRIFSL